MLSHVTIDTGDIRRSPRSEVADGVIAICRRIIAQVVDGERATIPNVGATITGAAQDDQLVAVVWTDDGEALVSIVVARSDAEAESSWLMLHDPSGREGMEVMPIGERRAGAPPGATWVAARLHIGIVDHMDAAHWLGDFERCLGWAWIESESGR
jgi:hypothetical protein